MSWPLGPFTRHPGTLLGPDPTVTFDCPLTGAVVAWAAKDVFNPAAVVHEGRVCLLVRAEDLVGPIAGVSRIGLATSVDGIHFELEPEPVLFPADDGWQHLEWPGGCEDPRVVEAPDGGFVCTYTGFAGRRPILMVATSDDLRTWVKHGPAFAGTAHEGRAAKSGSIVTEVRDGRLVAGRVGGRHWMYWGEGTAFAATSDDLVHWEPVEFDATGDRELAYGDGRWSVHHEPGVTALRPLLWARPGRFDSRLVEPGPPAVRTDDGIVLVYNGANAKTGGDPSLADRAYAPGQALFDLEDPTSCIARATEPFLRPESAAEQHGQVDNVCFAEGLVLFEGRWLLYFGMADSRIGLAVHAPTALASGR